MDRARITREYFLNLRKGLKFANFSQIFYFSLRENIFEFFLRYLSLKINFLLMKSMFCSFENSELSFSQKNGNQKRTFKLERLGSDEIIAGLKFFVISTDSVDRIICKEKFNLSRNILRYINLFKHRYCITKIENKLEDVNRFNL